MRDRSPHHANDLAGGVVTGEAVALDIRPAAVPSRLLAALLDGLVQAVLLTGLLALAARLVAEGSGARAGALALTIVVGVLVGYPVLLETLLRGRTLGKAALGLRVVRDDGGPVGFRHALVRGLVGVVVERPGVTLGAGAVITSLLEPRGKRIGDLLAGTVVVRERVAGRAWTTAAEVPPGLEAWAASLDLSGLSDDLALSARRFLGRVGELSPPAREDLGGRLAAAVVAAVTPPPPVGTPGWAVLTAVLAERRRRDEVRAARPAAAAPALGSAPPPSSVAPSPPDGQAAAEVPRGAAEPGSGGFVVPS